jgi:type IV pilus assembly protein PilX
MKTIHAPTAGLRQQRGISLIFALITLVSMLVAAIALVRSVNSGSQVLGNIGFQQDATASADYATSEALAYLSAATTDLTASSTATNGGAASSRTGFYASAWDAVDVTGQQLTATTRQLVDWDLDGCGYASAGTYAGCTIIPHDVDMSSNPNASSVSARYVVFRICQADGATSTTTCAPPVGQTSSGGSARGACEGNNDGCKRLGSTGGSYYRIVVRVVGARGTTSFTETTVQY